MIAGCAICLAPAAFAWNTPRFDPIQCPTDVLPKQLANAHCGYLTVPEDRSQQFGRTIQLFVAIIPAQSGKPASDPVATGAPMSWRLRTNGCAYAPSNNLTFSKSWYIAGLEANRNGGSRHREARLIAFVCAAEILGLAGFSLGGRSTTGRRGSPSGKGPPRSASDGATQRSKPAVRRSLRQRSMDQRWRSSIESQNCRCHHLTASSSSL